MDPNPRLHTPAPSPLTYQFRACPRCSGDLVNGRDEYGPETFCLQCGYRKAPGGKLNLAFSKEHLF